MIRAQHGHYGLAQRTEVARVAVHLADRDGEKVEERCKVSGLVQDLVLQLGKSLALETRQRGGERRFNDAGA